MGVVDPSVSISDGGNAALSRLTIATELNKGKAPGKVADLKSDIIKAEH